MQEELTGRCWNCAGSAAAAPCLQVPAPCLERSRYCSGSSASRCFLSFDLHHFVCWKFQDTKPVFLTISVKSKISKLSELTGIDRIFSEFLLWNWLYLWPFILKCGGFFTHFWLLIMRVAGGLRFGFVMQTVSITHRCFCWVMLAWCSAPFLLLTPAEPCCSGDAEHLPTLVTRGMNFLGFFACAHNIRFIYYIVFISTHAFLHFNYSNHLPHPTGGDCGISWAGAACRS